MVSSVHPPSGTGIGSGIETVFARVVVTTEEFDFSVLSDLSAFSFFSELAQPDAHIIIIAVKTIADFLNFIVFSFMFFIKIIQRGLYNIYKPIILYHTPLNYSLVLYE